MGLLTQELSTIGGDVFLSGWNDQNWRSSSVTTDRSFPFKPASEHSRAASSRNENLLKSSSLNCEFNAANAPAGQPFFQAVSLRYCEQKQLPRFAIPADAGHEDLIVGAVPARGGILP